MTKKSFQAKYFPKVILSLLSLFIIFSPLFVFAQDGTINEKPDGTINKPSIKYDIKIENPFKSKDVEGLLKAIVNEILMPIGAVIATIMVIYAGFLFATARGNATQIETAKKALFYALIGAAILLGAWVIVNALSATIDKLRA